MGDNPVYRCIAQLRRALGDDPREPRYITTVPTKGYRLIAPVEVHGAERRAPPVVPDRRHEPAPAAPASDAPMPTRSPWRPWLGPTLLLLMLCVVALAAWVRHRAPDASVASVAAPVPIAVLPLQAAAHDEAGTALAQSATDVIRHGLARLPGLVVVADTSAAHVPGAAGEARAMGASPTRATCCVATLWAWTDGCGSVCNCWMVVPASCCGRRRRPGQWASWRCCATTSCVASPTCCGSLWRRTTPARSISTPLRSTCAASGC
ncbi:hypothetical protein RLIN73S_05842 [Rhodanobacter lindaniclasticus]